MKDSTPWGPLKEQEKPREKNGVREGVVEGAITICWVLNKWNTCRTWR